MENEWRKEMCRLRDAIFYCPQCTAENFMDIDLLRRKVNLNPCWSCGKHLVAPPQMRITAPHHDSSLVALSSGVRFFPHHLEGEKYNFSAPLAEVTGPPMGLKNRAGSGPAETGRQRAGGNTARGHSAFTQRLPNSPRPIGGRSSAVNLFSS